MSKPLPLSAACFELMRRMAMCKRAGKFTGAAKRAGMRWHVQFKIFRDALSPSRERGISIVWPRSHTGQTRILLFDLKSTHPSAPTRACNTPSARSIAQGRQPQRGDRAAGTRVAQATWVGLRSALRDASTAAVSCGRGGRLLMPAKFISSPFRVTCSVTLCQTPQNCGCYAKFHLLPFVRLNSKNLRITQQKRMSARMECTYRK